MDRLQEAEVSLRQAIALDPNFSEAHSNLGVVFYKIGDKNSALKSIQKANEIDPKAREPKLLLSVIRSRKNHKERKIDSGDVREITTSKGLKSNPLILYRAVEDDLIASLYEMNSIQLDKTKRVGLLAAGKVDARYGNGLVSPDFNLFEDARSIIQKVAEDLTKVMVDSVQSDIFIYESFFNILIAGGGTAPHAHLNTLDRNTALGLGKQKYSLVYYLSVGDQNCSEPGILKLYEPGEDILPYGGMIMIFPAARYHSAVYGGKTDRVMIGVNFYSL